MLQQHAGSGVPHYFFDFFFHVGPVAVDDTFAACALLLLKRTLVKTHKGVCLELCTVGAEVSVGSVVGFAVYLDHGSDGFLFPRDPRMLKFGLFNRHWVTSCKLYMNKLSSLT
jgi:hypothetical protein